MTSNQADTPSSLIPSQSASLVAESPDVPENPLNLQDPISSTIEVPSTLDKLNCNGWYFVIWNADTKDDFTSWWNQLSAAQECKQSGSGKTHPNWSNTHRKSDFWTKFHQAAAKKTGIPCIICKKCNMILAHPTYSKNGTSGMKKHAQSRDCDLNATANRATSDIDSSMLVS